MNVKRKYLFWLIPAVLVLLAVLFFLYPRRRTRSCICGVGGGYPRGLFPEDRTCP